MSYASRASLTAVVSAHAPGFIIGLYFLSLQFVATINISYLILLAGLLFLLATQASIRWRGVPSSAGLVAALLFSSTAISAHFATDGAVNPAIAISEIPGLLIFLIIVLFVRNEEQLSCVVLSFLIVLCITFWQFLQASCRADFARGVALVYQASHPLYLAANDVLMLSIVLPLVFWFGQRSTAIFWRRLVVFSYVFLLMSLSILLLSRISLLITGVSLIFYLSPQRRRSILWLIFILFIIAAIAAYYFDPRFAAKLHSLDLARLRIWIIAARMFADAPSFGHGPGSFSVLYGNYLAQLEVPLRVGNEIRNIGWAHNLFLESMAEKGLFGLFAVLSYFSYTLVTLRRRLKERRSELDRALAISMALCLMAACVELSLLRVWGIYIVYLLLGLVAAFAADSDNLSSSQVTSSAN